MNVNKASIIISAVSPLQYPEGNTPEVAFVGRSNVGKSSLINKLVNRRSLARISSKPGKTNTINFYNIDDKLYFVDLPGYGFAKVSKAEKQKWGKMIEEYLSIRQQLRHVVLLVDSRHKPTEDDVIMLDWIRHFGYKVLVVATKCDKLSSKQIQENMEIANETLSLNEDDKLIPFSIKSNDGKEEFWKSIKDDF